MAVGRDEGGLGGFREGVGKREGLCEGDKDSDIVEERKVGRGEREKIAVLGL